MKKTKKCFEIIVLLAIVFFIVVSCGGPSMVGTWESSNGNTITFTETEFIPSWMSGFRGDYVKSDNEITLIFPNGRTLIGQVSGKKLVFPDGSFQKR